MSINRREIFGWKAKDRITDLSDSDTIAHSCVLVGAEKWENGNEMVYYIDPSDGSDPKDPTQQRIYTMSYKRLTDYPSICAEVGGTFTKTTRLPYAYRSATLKEMASSPRIKEDSKKDD
jgi:hypothetical protein